MKLKINITKEVLKKSMWCGTGEMEWCFITKSCAIALAICNVFPNASVIPGKINLIGTGISIKLPNEATKFIETFDSLRNTPEERLNLPEFSFEIEVPESVIDQINIDDIKNSNTLELCEN